MSDLLIGALSALLATNQPAALSNLVRNQTGLSVPIPDVHDPVAKEYQRILALDDDAQEEVQRWMRERDQLRTQPTELEATLFRGKVRQRFDPVKKAYEDFLQANPRHARARLAYGSFLNDIGDEEAAHAQWIRATELDPQNPAAWNNLANFYGHHGPVTNAFACYVRALALRPDEALYYQNFATTVFLFRQDARSFFGITEEQVFDKSIDLYRQARRLEPDNFLLATDLAQSYYALISKAAPETEAAQATLKRRMKEALAAWDDALKLAGDDTARQGVQLHQARWLIHSGRLDDARRTLALITNGTLATSVRALSNKLAKIEAGTNAPPASIKETPPAPAATPAPTAPPPAKP